MDDDESNKESQREARSSQFDTWSRLAAAALEPPPRGSRLKSVTSSPLTVAIVSFVLTGGIGFGLTNCHDENVRNRERLSAQAIRDRDSANAQIIRDRERDNALRDIRTRAVRELAELMYDRLTAGELLSSAIIRDATPAEFRARRQFYDSAYVRWNRRLDAFVSVREITGAVEYSAFDARHYALHNYFSTIDAMLTAAADSFERHRAYSALYVRARPGDLREEPCDSVRSDAISLRCHVRLMSDSANRCIYALVNGLWIFAAMATDSLSADSVGAGLDASKPDSGRAVTNRALEATSGPRHRALQDVTDHCRLRGDPIVSADPP